MVALTDASRSSGCRDKRSLAVGVFAEKEIDMLGVACCGDGEFVTAVDSPGAVPTPC
jgi:hypothetical protein